MSKPSQHQKHQTQLAPQARLIVEALKNHPEIPARTLARHLAFHHPEVFKTVDNARSAIRYQLGTKGERSRGQQPDKSNFRGKRNAGENWKQYLPEVTKESKQEWGPRIIEKAGTTLILSDIHFPFHSETALTVAIERGIKAKPDVILLNGDTADFYSLSRFTKDPSLRDLKNEVETIKWGFLMLRDAFPDAEIIYKMGNHDERYEHYLMDMAPVLWGLENTSVEALLEFENYGIELVNDKRPVQIGKLNVIHGHEYPTVFSPVNPARGMFLRAGSHTICGHFHRSSQHSEQNIEGHITSTFSTGCLCGLRPKYRPLNNWNHGAAIVYTDSDGAFEVDNFRIIGKRAY